MRVSMQSHSSYSPTSNLESTYKYWLHNTPWGGVRYGIICLSLGVPAICSSLITSSANDMLLFVLMSTLFCASSTSKLSC